MFDKTITNKVTTNFTSEIKPATAGIIQATNDNSIIRGFHLNSPLGKDIFSTSPCIKREYPLKNLKVKVLQVLLCEDNYCLAELLVLEEF